MSVDLLKTLERDGLVTLPPLLSPETLSSMQEAFAARASQLRFGDCGGYEQTEPFRHMVPDVLTLDPGFLELALHPRVRDTLTGYMGERFRLTEAKGWTSIPTRRSFHGWHGDAWYDQEIVDEIPREVKLAVYLTDVTTGEFQYIRGSHRSQHPRMVGEQELSEVAAEDVIRMLGPAGTAFLFDTSGIHRQSEPVLERRRAVFFNYHDPSVPVQAEDTAYYRYHPLLLNAAFLGDLDERDRRILGFGDRNQYIHAYQRKHRFPVLHRLAALALGLRLEVDDLWSRVRARLR